MSIEDKPRIIPIFMNNRYFGEVRIDLKNDKREYITHRKPKTLFQNTPCRKHQGKCQGFTISMVVVKRIKELGINVIKVIFTTNQGLVEEYITNLVKLEAAAITHDNEGVGQYSLPVHEWLKIEAFNLNVG